MTQIDRPTLDVRRGLCAAGWCALAGALIPGSLVLAFFIYRRLNPLFSPTNSFLEFLEALAEFWPFPVCGLAAFLGCAAWATFAPPGSWRFVGSLAIIFGISVASWILVGFMDNLLDLDLLRLRKGEDHRILRLSQALVLFGPPAAVAQLLALLRLGRTKAAAGERRSADPAKTQ